MADRIGIIVKGTLAFESDFTEDINLEKLFMDVCRNKAQESAAEKGGNR